MKQDRMEDTLNELCAFTDYANLNKNRDAQAHLHSEAEFTAHIDNLVGSNDLLGDEGCLLRMAVAH